MKRLRSVRPVDLLKFTSSCKKILCFSPAVTSSQMGIRIGSAAFIVISMAAAGMAHAETLPSQDDAVALAVVSHPEVVAAKAKVALAEAELYGKRMEVSRQILGMYGNLKTLDLRIDASRSALKRLRDELESAKLGDSKGTNQGSRDALAAELRAVEAELVQTIGQREQVEKELHFQLGMAVPAVLAGSLTKTSGAARQTPQGPIVEKMRIAGEKQIKFDFDQIPLHEVLKQLSSSTGVMFSLQGPAFEDAGIGTDMPISLRTSEVRLCDALQAFEDANPQLQFVLRDYGVLVTTKEHAEQEGYTPVLELIKESLKATKLR